MFMGVANISPQDPSLRPYSLCEYGRNLLFLVLRSRMTSGGCYNVIKQGYFNTMQNPALVILERKRRISGGDVSIINI